MNIEKHQVYFTQKDYRNIKNEYQNEKNKKISSNQLLLIAKSYFFQNQYEECISILNMINYKNEAKVLFQKQTLMFKAHYLFNNQNTQKLDQVLDYFQSKKNSVIDKNFLQYHFNVFKQFRQFLQTHKTKLQKLSIKSKQQKQNISISQLDKQRQRIRQSQKQYEKQIKFQGLPCFLVQKIWRKKYEDYMKGKTKKLKIKDKNGSFIQIQKDSEDPGPISNLSLVNHIFEIFPYQNQKNDMNTILFPGDRFQIVSKKHWNYLSKQFQGFPIRRIYGKRQKFINQIYFDSKMTTTFSILINNQLFVMQILSNSRVQYSISSILSRKFGDGQLKQAKQEEKYTLVSPNKPFQLKSVIPLKYVTFNLYNVKNLNDQQLKFQSTLIHLYDFQKYQIKNSSSNGIVGLTNDKFFCFMNSTLQCLSSTYQLSKYFLQNQYISALNYSVQNIHGSRGEIASAYAEIVKKSWMISNKSNKYPQIDPSIFKQVFSKRFQNFTQDSQEDAHQFLNFLLNCMHDDLNKLFKENDRKIFKTVKSTTQFQQVRNTFIQNYENYNESKITDLFKGYTFSTLHCLECQTNYYNFDMHLTIPLPLPQPNPSIHIYYLNTQNIQAEAIHYGVFLNEIKFVKDIINTILDHRNKNQKKKKEENQTKEVFLLGVNNKNFKFQTYYTEELQIKKLMQAQNKQFFFLYEVARQIKEKKKQGFFQLSDVIQEQKDEKIVFVQYKDQQQRKGYPKLILLDPYTSQEDLIKKAAETLCDQSLGVSGGLATQKQKIESIQKVKLQKAKEKPFEYVMRVSLKKKLYWFREKQSIEEIGQKSKEIEFNLESCFNIFNEKEKIQISEEWRCAKCRKICAAQKKERIYSVGSHIIIVLKRFTQQGKIYTKVDYPVENLDISRFIDQQYRRKINSSFVYDLYGVIVHRGTLNRGHYYSYCKNMVTKKWYQMDDQTVREQTDPKVVVDKNAYILFYRRQNQ